MQASYLPTGALGDVVQVRNEKLGPYNQNTAALPQSYGAFAKIYTTLKYGPNKKPVPMTSDGLVWTLVANGFYGIPADALSTPERYYFTLPTFVQQGYGPELEKAADVSGHPVLGQCPAFFLRNSSTGNREYVLLSKDRKLPFTKVTKGEYLQATEAAIARLYESGKQKIARDNVGNQRSIDYFMGYLNAKNDKRLAVLSSNKEKVQESPAGDRRNLDGRTRRDARELSRRVRGQRGHGDAVARLHDRSPAGRTVQDRRTPVDRHVVDGAVERPRQPEPARGHPQQRQPTP